MKSSLSHETDSASSVKRRRVVHMMEPVHAHSSSPSSRSLSRILSSSFSLTPDRHHVICQRSAPHQHKCKHEPVHEPAHDDEIHCRRKNRDRNLRHASFSGLEMHDNDHHHHDDCDDDRDDGELDELDENDDDENDCVDFVDSDDDDRDLVLLTAPDGSVSIEGSLGSHDLFSMLPDDILQVIFEHLKFEEDLTNVALLSRRFYRISHNSNLKRPHVYILNSRSALPRDDTSGQLNKNVFQVERVTGQPHSHRHREIEKKYSYTHSSCKNSNYRLDYQATSYDSLLTIKQVKNIIRRSPTKVTSLSFGRTPNAVNDNILAWYALSKLIPSLESLTVGSIIISPTLHKNIRSHDVHTLSTLVEGANFDVEGSAAQQDSTAQLLDDGKLSFSNCTFPVRPVHFGRHFGSLPTLSFSGFCFPNLVSMTLSLGRGTNIHAINLSANSIPKLKHLFIEANEQVPFVAFSDENIPQLEKLSLISCEHLAYIKIRSPLRYLRMDYIPVLDRHLSLYWENENNSRMDEDTLLGNSFQASTTRMDRASSHVTLLSGTSLDISAANETGFRRLIDIDGPSQSLDTLILHGLRLSTSDAMDRLSKFIQGFQALDTLKLGLLTIVDLDGLLYSNPQRPMLTHSKIRSLELYHSRFRFPRKTNLMSSLPNQSLGYGTSTDGLAAAINVSERSLSVHRPPTRHSGSGISKKTTTGPESKSPFLFIKAARLQRLLVWDCSKLRRINVVTRAPLLSLDLKSCGSLESIDVPSGTRLINQL